jgi:polyhydroxybutyrate depolymerase
MRKILLRVILIILAALVLIPLLVMAAFLISNRTNGKLVSGGETRRYLLYVPDTYDPAVPAPLVITIHGFMQWPANQMQVSGWNQVADEEGFIVVYPMGTNFPLRWRTWAVEAGDDGPQREVQFFADLIDALQAEYNIDPKRIYANGLSNGGGMSFLLACELSERIAAFGGVAGAYSTPLSACSPTRPVPAILFHGTADTIVPYEGGVYGPGERTFPSIPEWASQLARLNGCQETEEDLPDVGDTSGVQYTQCSQGAEVIFYTIHGGGHAWPGGDPLPEWIVGYTSQDINTTRLIWAFFERFTLP